MFSNFQIPENVEPKSPRNRLRSRRSRDRAPASEKGLRANRLREGPRTGRCRSLVDDVSQQVSLSSLSVLGKLLTLPRLKVLSEVGVAEFVTNSAPHLAQFCDRASDGTDLGVSSIPQSFVEKYGFPGCGVKRTALNLKLKEALAAAGIIVHEGWKLKEVTKTENGVIALSEDGRKVEGSFLIGCDGIKAVSRSLVLREHGASEEKAEYTRLTQASRSPIPKVGVEY